MMDYRKTSKLLIDEYPLMVSPTLAKLIGLNEAIVIQQVHFWLDNPKSGVVHAGRRWIWNSYSEWEAQFSFWSESTMKRVIKSCKESHILLVARLKQKQGDQTNYFSIDYDKLDDLLKASSGAEGQNDTTPNGIGQNDTLHKVKMTWGGCQNDTLREGQNDTLFNVQRTHRELTENSSISPQTPKGAEGDRVLGTLPMDIDPKKKKTNTDEALIAECALKGVPPELLVDYLQYRRRVKKKPLTTTQGLQAQINILAELGDEGAMWAALNNTKDYEYFKIVPKAPVEPSTPSTAMVVTAASHGLTNGTVDAEMKLMIQHYKSKGFKVWDWDAAFSRWLDNKARFEAVRVPAKTAVPRFSPSTDTSWIKELDPAELGFNCTAEEWRNA